MLPFRVQDLKERFIGTERGDLTRCVSEKEAREQCDTIPQLQILRRTHPRLAAVVHRYVHDMGNAFDQCRRMLRPGGTCVVVCGDNLLGGQRISTWRVLDRLLGERGFVLRDRFRDSIQDRLLAPKRSGHRGLIKEEVVSAYSLGSRSSSFQKSVLRA
jgi:threonine dehydrogenase-like Zn-dependent dehydrogenase